MIDDKVETTATTTNTNGREAVAGETVLSSIDQQIIRVPLTQLIPFSGTLYDEHGNPVPVSGNPFSVPEDYLAAPQFAPNATTADETSEASNTTDTDNTASSAGSLTTDAGLTGSTESAESPEKAVEAAKASESVPVGAV